ncbi:MAG TPA: glycosyltransferase [Tepidisphaeraceae bacterium]|nr:glycosyltransferase [Tepidisphaeraceae bacterium]
MISVVACSLYDAKLKAVQEMYRRAIPGEMEFIGARNPPSIAEGYNCAAQNSKGDILIFSHDDVEIISPDFARIVEATLKEYDLLGVAGTDKLVGPKWLNAGPPHLFGQIIHASQEPGIYSLNIYGAPRRCVGNIQALDGVFMAMRREVWETIRFDEINFDGFHIYDVDFSFSAFLAGRKLCVRNDIHLYHSSRGDYADPNWSKYADRLTKKHGSGFAAHRQRKHQWAGTYVCNWDEAREIMTPTYWDAQ